MPDFNKTLKDYRKMRGLTQAELGNRVGMSSQVISNWERGYTTGISVDMINKLAEALGIGSAFLIGTSKSFDGSIDYSNDFYDNDFQDRVKNLMSESNITYESLLKNTGLTKEVLDGYLYARKQPSLDHLIKLSRVLDVSIDYLLDNSRRKRLSYNEEILLSSFEKCNIECQNYLIAKAGVLSVEGISAVAATEKERYVDSLGKSHPSSGTEGNAKIG